MDFVLKVWQWLNGKKTVLGAVAVALSVLAEQLGVLHPLFGVDAVIVAKAVGAALFVVGAIHKLIKALG